MWSALEHFATWVITGWHFVQTRQSGSEDGDAELATGTCFDDVQRRLALATVARMADLLALVIATVKRFPTWLKIINLLSNKFSSNSYLKENCLEKDTDIIT